MYHGQDPFTSGSKDRRAITGASPWHLLFFKNMQKNLMRTTGRTHGTVRSDRDQMQRRKAFESHGCNRKTLQIHFCQDGSFCRRKQTIGLSSEAISAPQKAQRHAPCAVRRHRHSRVNVVVLRRQKR
jgi:hypothetical protein